MSVAAGVVLFILVAAFLLFVSGWLRPDLVAVLVLLSLVLTRVIEPETAFTGFSSFAVMAIAGLMIIGEGLQRTGVVQWVAPKLERIIRQKHERLILVNTGIPAALSGFVNIVAAASFFIPVILRLCKQMKVPHSKILLPMACSALIGANLSLIGASHNFVVHSLLERAQGRGFGFFEFTILGAVLLVAALIYIFVLGDKLLPGAERTPEPTKVPVTADLAKTYELEDRVYEVWISEGLAEKSYTVESLQLDEFGLTLLALVREGDNLLFPANVFKLEEGDMLLLQGREDVIPSFCEARKGITFLGAPKGQEAYPISTAELAEAVVPPRSKAIGKSVNQLNMDHTFAEATRRAEAGARNVSVHFAGNLSSHAGWTSSPLNYI